MAFNLPILKQPSPAPSAPGDSPIAPPRPGSEHPPTNLIDSHGRVIRDLRLSVTDRCNFRCVYCMDPDVRFARKIHLLTDTELVRLARICLSLGVRRIRLTGGEPALHPTLTELIKDINALGPEDLTMTTNGSLAGEQELRRWRQAGLRRLTISIDSLHPERFSKITRSATKPERVIETIRAAKRVGLGPVKVNAVVVRGFNDDELPSLASLARDLDVDVRLIEYMPLDSGGEWGRQKLVPGDEIVERIGARHALRAIGHDEKQSPATMYEFEDGEQAESV